MTFLKHVWILTQKNFHIIKRSKLWFLAELLFGLLLLPLFIFIVSKSSTDITPSRAFSAVPITGDQRDLMRYVNNIQRIGTKMCNAKKLFGYVSTNEIGDEIMRDFESRYNHYKVPVNVTKFDTLEAMKTTLLDDLNMTSNKVCGKFMGGVHLSEIDLTEKKFKYRIYVRDRGGNDWETNEFWPSDGPYGTLSDLNDIPSKPGYWSSGFLTFQFALDKIFLEKTGKNTSMEVFLWRLPTPKFRNNGLLAILTTMPILFIFLVLAIMIHTTKEVVTEKEAGIKTHLMVMGLQSSAFYASHFLTALIKVLIVVGSSTFVLSLGFDSISPFVFVVFCLLFGIASVLFSLLVSVLCRRTSTAVGAVLLIWIGLFILDTYLKVSPTRVGTCFIAALNVFTAFHLGLSAMFSYESRLLNLTWFNIFAESTTSFSVGTAFFMLIVDCLIFCFLIYYLDAVWPTDDSPKKSPLFIFPFIHTKDVGHKVDLDAASNNYSENCETDGGVGRDEADISIQNMSKVWETGQVAVDGLSLNAFRGQVTVLLGHNGAGKSTTFSVVSGVCSSTRGEVFICKKSISNNLQDCQKEIGYCPQTNPLFGKLTVEEHLRLYGKLKAEVWDERSESRLKDIISANQLSEKTHELAESLSGGQKRKLCVAMALVGDSKVVLLDEPTAGMDPEARHEICKMLEKEKKKRTILLTTHYMDEADLLGDQIAIMVKGRLVCKGSPEYLKNRFGTGYILTLVIEPHQPLPEDSREKEAILEGIRKKLLEIVHKQAPDAVLESSFGLQFSIILPVKDKKYFANMFEELEERKENLQISSFGLSFNTLEQVFLKVGEIAEAQGDHVDGQTMSRAEALFQSEEAQFSKPVQVLKQIGAVFQRYAIGACRNKVRTLLPLLVAVFLFSVVAFFQNQTGKLQQRDLSLLKQEPLTIPMQFNQQEQIHADFPYIAGKYPGGIPLTVSPHDNFTKMILKHSYDSPALGIGAYVAPNGSIFALFNGAAYHTPPLVISFLTNAILQEKADSIQASVEIYSSDLVVDVQSVVTPVATIFVNILTILCFSFFTSMFVMPLVEDRVSNFKHQLLLTNLNRFTYWSAVTLWNISIYFLFCMILATILFISGWMEACMNTNFVFWALFFWSSVPFVYVCSFIFTSPMKAFVALLCWNVIGGIVASVATQLVNLLGSVDLANALTTLFSVILPSYALGHGVMEVTMQCPVLGKIVRWDTLQKVMICMTASGIVFWILLVLCENTLERIIYSLRKRFNQGKYEAVDTQESEDDDVRNERVRMNQLADDKLALSVRDVSKYYADFCALKNLTFGVNPTDCFGLLGINGAGKTTTFDILTGRKFASNGYAYIKGVDIRQMPAIGYCPQFDALALDLTGRQTLTLVGHLNGFVDVGSRVESVLESIHMEPQADKLVLHYSGGQKRRLSIGVTLMSRASLIMLDEPTAGIDPKTRRHIWNLLSAVRERKEVAILLTSHSMDECEALCSRIGFLNKGSLISIGTSQHLKSRYGNSFLLTFTIDNPNKHNRDHLNKEVMDNFTGVVPTQDLEYMNTYHWDIPRQGNNDSWSSLYKKAQEIAMKYNKKDDFGRELPVITDFSVTQNSLEQVFLRLTQLGASLEEHSPRQGQHGSGSRALNV